jgi:hypothetical protein
MSIYEALIKTYAAVENVVRKADGQVGNQRYKYATLEDVLNMMRPILAENKLAAIQYVEGDELKTELIHQSGEKLELGAYNLGALSKHQERGSAITYGRRYVLCSVFGIAQEDDDGASADKIPPVFKNAATRKAWCDSIIKLIEESTNADDLQKVYLDNAARLKQCRDGQEHDTLAYEELMQRFSRRKAQLIEEEESIAKIKQQLGE